ncbi:DUF2267 domain-containing protein [Microbispora sp. RL4-1S]|uniref:DUF2267 domain-containing protein n=1 Tax=Microbispora oryzae TaxID=2806554 RepID=A0A941ALK2_9ACTN|nr:DUF2267 domain-containing protein [Microbispora oryzae]MBP2708236.1 DUF2267 domain-containing protein [Microbispora oryzae]
MASARVHSLDRTVQTTNRWLADLAASIGTEDREFAHRVLRTWLHAVRDGLTVDGAAHLAAQLPDLLRGVFYNGWDPSAVPVRRERQEFIEHFALTGRIAHADVRKLAPVVTKVICDEVSENTVRHALVQLPRSVRELLEPAAKAAPDA